LQITSRNKLMHKICRYYSNTSDCWWAWMYSSDWPTLCSNLALRDAPRAEAALRKTFGPQASIPTCDDHLGRSRSEVRYLADQVVLPKFMLKKVRKKNSLSSVKKLPLPKHSTWWWHQRRPCHDGSYRGMAIGQNSDVTAEAAGVVVMDNSLKKVMNLCISVVECASLPSRAR